MSDARRRRIGFVTIWFERGQAYVTRALRDALAESYETFVFARMGQVGTQEGVQLHQQLDGDWAVPNLTTHPTYDIDDESIRQWIRDNELDVVVFNEEYDWHLVDYCKRLGCKVATYLDFYRDDWRDALSTYDAILCSTRRTFDLVRDSPSAHFVGWAIDTSRFRPQPGEATHTFFHSAGWLGINYRKNTPAVIDAFAAIASQGDLSLLVHSQLPATHLPARCQQQIASNDRITFHVGTVGQPGMYHRGRIYVYPSKLDGLGLTLLEALSCGLPAITTDGPPMNEFVDDKMNGRLVPVAEQCGRADAVAFPEMLVDVHALSQIMAATAADHASLDSMSRSARERALTQFDQRAFGKRLSEVFDGLWE